MPRTKKLNLPRHRCAQTLIPLAAMRASLCLRGGIPTVTVIEPGHHGDTEDAEKTCLNWAADGELPPLRTGCLRAMNRADCLTALRLEDSTLWLSPSESP